MTIHSILQIIIIFTVIFSGCSSPVDGNIDNYRWIFLGLEGKSVTAVEDTPWGLFAGTVEDGVFRYNESSKSWVSLGLDHAIISGIAYAPTDTPMVLVAVTCCRIGQVQSTPAAIFASVDGGEFWFERDGGLARGNVDSFWANSILVDEKEPERMFFGGETFQLLYSEDVGITWEYVSGGPGQGGGETFSIVLSPDRDGRIWFGGQTAFSSPVIYRSDDWGRDAKIVYHRTIETAVLQILVDEEDANKLWLVQHQGGISVSTNGGDTWKVILPSLMESEDKPIFFTA